CDNDITVEGVSSKYGNDQVNSKPCVDAVYNGAYLQNDDYSIKPEFIFDDWQERTNDELYDINTNIDVDCFDDDLSAGAIAGIVIACLVAVGAIGLLVFCCCCRD
ncbi:hypothetical protein LSH36_298g03000, partial [Paralvinella palmiformis]